MVKGFDPLKKRLDVLLYEKNLAESRERAKAMIMSGLVYVDNQKSDKPGALVSETSVVEVRGTPLRYVSRGGLKLEKAVNEFQLDLQGKICMDVGASTGGFTDCMLQNGAKKVYAIDVGYGQLAWKLRTDARVVNLERTNARYLTETQITDDIDLTSIDVSFISLSKILPVVYGLLTDNGYVVCLIKPQFEAGRDKVGKKGVVRSRETHIEVVRRVCLEASEMMFTVQALTFSPVKGSEGNIEYLALLQKTASIENGLPDGHIEEIVMQSHVELDGALV